MTVSDSCSAGLGEESLSLRAEPPVCTAVAPLSLAPAVAMCA